MGTGVKGMPISSSESLQAIIGHLGTVPMGTGVEGMPISSSESPQAVSGVKFL